MFLGSIMLAMLMPGIIGTSTDRAMTAEPMSKLLLYCAALGLQKISGAKNSQMPTNATAHCAQVLVRGTSDSAPNSRSEEHTSELQSLMRISYAVFCLKKKTHKYTINTQ